MAYTIKIHTDKEMLPWNVREKLIKALDKDKRFRCDINNAGFIYRGPREGSRKEGYGLILRRVRLTEKKEYCGQHFGVCVVNPFTGPQKKKKTTHLEYNDWIEFHDIVNNVLDKMKLDADVWTDPRECTGRYWIRKGMNRRVNFDAEQIPSNHWAPQYKWDNGSASQFV